MLLLSSMFYPLTTGAHHSSSPPASPFFYSLLYAHLAVSACSSDSQSFHCFEMNAQSHMYTPQCLDWFSDKLYHPVLVSITSLTHQR